MFRHRQQLRRWAAQVLLLWLFGVGVGVANACLSPQLQVGRSPSPGQATVAAMLQHGATVSVMAHHHGAGQAHHDHGAHDQQDSPGRSNCQDFCDKASVSIPSLKSALDDVQGHALALPVVAVVMPAQAHAPVQAWMPRRDGVRALPISIAFLRLAL